jgi:hypothetical protein
MPSLDPKDFVGRREDGIWDLELHNVLKATAEARRLEFLAGVLLLQEHRGLTTKRWLKLAGSVLNERASFEQLLRTGLGVANASTIRPWLQMAATHVGCRRLIHVLREEEITRPREVALTHYWLPSLAQSPAERQVVAKYLRERAPR